MVQAEKSDLELILANSKTPINNRCKEKVYEILYELRANAVKPFGAIVVLGYVSPKNSTDDFNVYTAPMDEDFFKESKPNIFDSSTKQKIAETLDFDGAILIDSEGNALHSGVYLRYKDYVDVLEDLKASKKGSLPERFGFSECVGTRHIAAICESYRMPETTIYIISEETRKIRIFEKGRIIYSPIKKEIWVPEEKLLPEELAEPKMLHVISS